MSTDQRLLDLLLRLQRETELLCVRGVRALSTEQHNWFDNASDQLGEMGAEFLSQKITAFLQAVDADDRLASGRLLDLLTTIRIFERVLTLRNAETVLHSIREVATL